MYRWTICDPLDENIIDKGEIQRSNIMETFLDHPWSEMLAKMESAKEPEIHYSPSLEFVNTNDKKGITFSAVGTPDNFIFYVFYMRQKTVKRLFGIYEKEIEKYSSDILGQSLSDSAAFLEEFLESKYSDLDDRFG